MNKILPSLKHLGRFFTITMFLLGSTDFLFGTANNPCEAAAAEGAGHAVWLSKYDNGSNASFIFDAEGGKLLEHEDKC